MDSLPDLLADFIEGLHPSLVSGALCTEIFDALAHPLKQWDPARDHEISAQSQLFSENIHARDGDLVPAADLSDLKGKLRIVLTVDSGADEIIKWCELYTMRKQNEGKVFCMTIIVAESEIESDPIEQCEEITRYVR